MSRPHGLLRVGFPFLATLGMRRMTNFPMDLAIGDEGRLYCLTRTEGIKVFNWDDEDLGFISGTGTGDGQLSWPVAIVRDRQENLYVSDERLHRISSFTKDGELLGTWGEHGDGDGQLNRPSGIAFDADENLYVVDSMNHRVQKFTRDGEFLAKWGGYGDGDGQFNMPWGIAVDELGDVYVADWRNDRIQKLSADGRYILEVGESGSEDGQLNRPSGVAVDSDGDIYVADRGNNRVQQFDATARYVDTFIGDATLGKAATTYVLANPRPLRLREMTPLGPQKRLRGPVSVKLDDQGRLYIADYGSYRFQVYQKQVVHLGPDQIAPPLRSPSLLVT